MDILKAPGILTFDEWVGGNTFVLIPQQIYPARWTFSIKYNDANCHKVRYQYYNSECRKVINVVEKLVKMVYYVKLRLICNLPWHYKQRFIDALALQNLQVKLNFIQLNFTEKTNATKKSRQKFDKHNIILWIKNRYASEKTWIKKLWK